MKKSTLIITLLILLLSSTDAQIIKLEKSLIDEIKNKITLHENYQLLSIGKVKPAKEDGDLHTAGKIERIGLPIVAELMNSKFQKNVIQYLKRKLTDTLNNYLKLSGAWRIWKEHSLKNSQIQFRNFRIWDSNPPHVFEIHPITKIDTFDLLKSVIDIKGYDYRSIKNFVDSVRIISLEISSSGKFIILKPSKIENWAANHLEFFFKIKNVNRIADGTTLVGDIYNCVNTRKKLASNIRIHFIKNTDADIKLEKNKVGDMIHVAGISRLDLTKIDTKIKKKKVIPLPYEFIIIAYIE